MDHENGTIPGGHQDGGALPPQATGRRAISYFGKRGEVVVVLEPEQKQTVPGKDAIPIAQLLRVVRKRLLVIVMVMVLFAGGVVGFDLTRPQVYEASITVLVAQKGPSGDPVDPGGLQGEVLGLQQVTQTVVEAADTRPVAEDAVRRLGLQTDPETLLDNLSATQVHATQFVGVNYRDTDPRRTRQVANAVGDALSERISEDSLSASTVTATVWERAEVPEAPVSPSLGRDVLAALVLGAMLGVALAFLLEHLHRGWHSPAEVEQISGAPNLGSIPKFAVRKGAASKAITGPR